MAVPKLRFKADDGSDYPELTVAKLDDLCEKIGDGLHGTPIYSQTGNYYFINGNNLENGKIIVSSDTPKVNDSVFEKNNKELNDSTILIVAQRIGTIMNADKIIVLDNYKKNGYDLHLVGKINGGYAIISTSIESIKKDAKTTMVVICLTSLISLLILLSFSYFISKLFSKKINEVKEVTDDIAALKFNKKINVNQNDELGDLFNNVNIMSKRLEDNIKELNKANIKLKEDLIEKS